MNISGSGSLGICFPFGKILAVDCRDGPCHDQHTLLPKSHLPPRRVWRSSPLQPTQHFPPIICLFFQIIAHLHVCSYVNKVCGLEWSFSSHIPSSLQSSFSRVVICMSSLVSICLNLLFLLNWVFLRLSYYSSLYSLIASLLSDL